MRTTVILSLRALALLLLFGIAPQPAHAADRVPPCKASSVTLYSADREAYSGKSKEYAAELQTKAAAYKQKSTDYAAQLTSEAGEHMAKVNMTAAEYRTAGDSYNAKTKQVAADYKTAGAEHQAETKATHAKYMAAGCDITDTAGTEAE